MKKKKIRLLCLIVCMALYIQTLAGCRGILESLEAEISQSEIRTNIFKKPAKKTEQETETREPETVLEKESVE